MPIYRRLPKRGFTPLKEKGTCGVLNIQDLQRLVDAKKIKSTTQVTLDLLRSCGAVRRSATELRILGKGKISTALKIEATYGTPSAVQAITAAGGKIILKEGASPSPPKKTSPSETAEKQKIEKVSSKKVPKTTARKTTAKPHSAEQAQQDPAPQKKARQRKKATPSEEQT
jgi:hypothetical protein